MAAVEARHWYPFRGLFRWLAAPSVLSLLVTLGSYALYLGVLHPGYAINDDIKIIAIAAGYPGVEPSPFLIFSNVLLGFLLVPLYQLSSPLNWEIILFVLLNVLSIWALLYLVIAARVEKRYRFLGAILILAGASYYGLNLTFSSTAVLACFAGLCAILGSARSCAEKPWALLAGGVGLIFAGSLIRIQMLALALPTVLTAAVFVLPTLHMRRVALGLGSAALLVFTGYSIDRLYVRAHPAWNAFYFYSAAEQQIQDSHRLENMHLEIRRIGWSDNDQELIARYFFPDAGTFSVDRLRYLVEKIPGVSENPAYTLGRFLQRLASAGAVPALLILAASWLVVLAFAGPGLGRYAVPLIAAAAVAESLALMIVYKNPDYVFLSSLANAAMLAVLMLCWPLVGVANPMPALRPRGFAVAATVCGLLTAVLAVSASAQLALQTSEINLGKQAAYEHILADLAAMQATGKLAANTVLVSGSHGLPWDWSNPLLQGFPNVTYLDTGWNTFSPYYDEALRAHGVEPLLDALYERDNVYMISKTIFKEFLARYYEEHQGMAVAFETLYRLPNPSHYEGYDDVELYRVIRQVEASP